MLKLRLLTANVIHGYCLNALPLSKVHISLPKADEDMQMCDGFLCGLRAQALLSTFALALRDPKYFCIDSAFLVNKMIWNIHSLRIP